MHELILEYEGRGKNTKTILLNIHVVAKELNRSVDLIVKCLSICLGVRAMLNDTTHRYILMGMHIKEDLLKIIDEIIDNYILCKYCTNPETTIYVKNYKLYLKCAACGSRSIIKCKSKLDDFVYKYISNLPKPQKPKIITQQIIMKHIEISHDDLDTKESITLVMSESSDSDEKWSVDVSDAAVALRKQELVNTTSIVIQALLNNY
jgi:translation initiation factor 5